MPVIVSTNCTITSAALSRTLRYVLADSLRNHHTSATRTGKAARHIRPSRTSSVDKQDRRADQRQHGGDQAVEAGLQHVLDRLDVVGGPAHHPARRVSLVERDVEPLEMPEHPPPQLEQHLLADPARALQEEHPAGGLDQHHPAQHADDDHQRVRRAAGQDRRDAVVDAALHQQRNRKARNVFHHDDERKQRDRQCGMASAASPAAHAPRGGAARSRRWAGRRSDCPRRRPRHGSSSGTSTG